MTLEQWAALDEDVEGELIDGVLEEEEMPTVLHEVVVAWLIGALRAWARPRGALVTGSEMKLAIASRRGRKPDAALFLAGKSCPPLSDALARVPPYVAVEVASPRPRDVRRDRVDKLRDYARAGVRYYWLVDPQLRSLEIFELGRSSRYTVAVTASGGRVRVPGCPALSLDLDALWQEIDEIDQGRTRTRKRSVRPSPARRARS
jgi:Uma2 family endonuclease